MNIETIKTIADCGLCLFFVASIIIFVIANVKHKPSDQVQETRIVLSQSDFKMLVNGGVVEKDGVKIILSDIGYIFMASIINEKLNDHD